MSQACALQVSASLLGVIVLAKGLSLLRLFLLGRTLKATFRECCGSTQHAAYISAPASPSLSHSLTDDLSLSLMIRRCRVGNLGPQRPASRSKDCIGVWLLRDGRVSVVVAASCLALGGFCTKQRHSGMLRCAQVCSAAVRVPLFPRQASARPTTVLRRCGGGIWCCSSEQSCGCIGSGWPCGARGGAYQFVGCTLHLTIWLGVPHPHHMSHSLSVAFCVRPAA